MARFAMKAVAAARVMHSDAVEENFQYFLSLDVYF